MHEDRSPSDQILAMSYFVSQTPFEQSMFDSPSRDWTTPSVSAGFLTIRRLCPDGAHQRMQEPH
jgi:hypothetical protein